MRIFVTDVTIAAAGTPQQLTNPAGSGSTGLFAKISFQAFPGNTNMTYVGIAGLVKATQANVAWTIPSRLATDPTTEVYGPEDMGGRNTLDCSQYWLDAAVNGEKIKVIFQQA